MNEKSILSRREFLRISALATTGAVLAACAPQVVEKTVEVPVEQTVVVEKEVEVEKVVTATPERVALEFVYHIWPGWQEAVAQIIENFEARHPNVSVTFIGVEPARRMEVLTPRFAAKDPPCLTAGDGILPWTEEGQMLDLRPLIDRDKVDLSLIKDIRGGQFRRDPVQGQYGLPLYLGGGLLAYNKDMFDEHGVSYPEPGWTLDDFREAAITLTRDQAGRSPRDADFDPEAVQVWGLQFWGGQTWDQFVRAFGGRIWSDDWETCTLDDPKTMECFAFFHELACEHHAIYGPGAVELPGAADPFVSARVAMSCHGDWMMSLWQQIEDFDWDVAATPEGPGGQWEYAASNTIGIAKECPHVDEAWEFVKYFVFDKEAQIVVGTTNGPALTELALSDEFLQLKLGARGPSLENVRWVWEMMHTHPTADYFLQTRHTMEWRPVWSDMQISLLTLCDRELEPLLAETSEQITEILAKE